jgi:tyrosinase
MVMIDKVWADWQDLHPGIPHYESVKPDYPVYPDTLIQPWKVDIGYDITANDLLDYKRLYTYD